MEVTADRDRDADGYISWDTDDDVEPESASIAGPSRADRIADNEDDKDFIWVSDNEEEEEKEHISNPVAHREAIVGSSCPFREDQGFDSEESKDFICSSDRKEKEHTSNLGTYKEAIFGPTREASDVGPSRPSLISHFVLMGYSEDMVVRAVKENGKEDTNAILDTLLTYAAVAISPSKHEYSPNRCSLASETGILDEDLSDMDEFECEEFTEDLSEKDRNVSTLVDMGFLAEEAYSAIERCGPNASVLELVDSIRAAQMAEESDGQQRYNSSSSTGDENYVYFSRKENKARGCEMKNDNKRRRVYERKKEKLKRVSLSLNDDVPLLSIPNPMIGFGIPFERARITERKLPEAAMGPPFFYYENVALAPKGVWDTISRFLHDIEPEFVDSKFFSAAARKRGYIHNLPIVNRFPLLPIPPKTIHEAFPITKKYWPKWDPRTQLNCLQTTVASAQMTERIRRAVANSEDPPPRQVQDFVLTQCRKWNLIWVGHHKVATLEPDEIETLLGFPRNHTRGGGINRTDRYKSLGNSFQIDTVAYHLSVLKDRYPSGMNVLSLFSGIGGAEVALHRLGIRLNTVVAVEILEVNRNIMRSWWEQTNQTGNLIDLVDVQELNGDRLEHLIKTYGRFDLIIGGSPCNNLSGNNRYTRDGLEGKHSSLFYDYFRILDLVKCIMGNSL